MSRILYYGIFFDENSKKIISSLDIIFFDENSKKIISRLDINKLDVEPEYFHITFRYLPNKDERINDVVGEEYTLKIIGSANNGKNSGVLIEIPKNIICTDMKKMEKKYQ